MNNEQIILALRDDACGSHSNSNLWYGSSLEEAGKAWRELSSDGEKEVYLTGWNMGTLASHKEMQWRFGQPRGTFACPICGKDTPHQHSAESIALRRYCDAATQREMEKAWEEIEARFSAALKRAQGETA